MFPHHFGGLAVADEVFWLYQKSSGFENLIYPSMPEPFHVFMFPPLLLGSAISVLLFDEFESKRIG
jgi:hypothetical protein